MTRLVEGPVMRFGPGVDTKHSHTVFLPVGTGANLTYRPVQVASEFWTGESTGSDGFGYAYDGWKVGSLDGNTYIYPLVVSAPAAYPAWRGPEKKAHWVDIVWRRALLALSDPMELLRLELSEGL